MKTLRVIEEWTGHKRRSRLTFLWDFRARQVNRLSFWYGFLQCLATVWFVRWLIESDGSFTWWRAGMVLLVAAGAKWCHARHAVNGASEEGGAPKE